LVNTVAWAGFVVMERFSEILEELPLDGETLLNLI
jgi:hypothetical protein